MTNQDVTNQDVMAHWSYGAVWRSADAKQRAGRVVRAPDVVSCGHVPRPGPARYPCLPWAASRFARTRGWLIAIMCIELPRVAVEEGAKDR